MNSITSDYLLMSFGNIMIAMAVLSNFIIIRHHDILPLHTLLSFLICSTTGNIYMLASYLKLGEINKLSKALISSTRRAVNGGSRKLALEDRRTFIKFLKSCNLYLRIYMSSFGYYRKATSIRIIGKIIGYTVRVLIITKKME
jgi:hypothetical protein